MGGSSLLYGGRKVFTSWLWFPRFGDEQGVGDEEEKEEEEEEEEGGVVRKGARNQSRDEIERTQKQWAKT